MTNETEKWNSPDIDWWNPNGPAKWIHRYNPLRLRYVIETNWSVIKYYNNVKILEIGCGGGVFTEQLAKICDNVTGIDLASNAISVAKNHADDSGIKNITYRCCSTADLVAEGKQYDIIVLSEVLEHVDSVEEILRDVNKLLSYRGRIVITTINRTFKSWLYCKLIGEYLFRLLPIGTHKWRKFVKPYELNKFLSSLRRRGSTYNIFTKKMEYCNSTKVNYMAVAYKSEQYLKWYATQQKELMEKKFIEEFITKKIDS